MTIRRHRTRASGANGSRGLVLMYHGIGDVDIDPWGLFVSAANFRNHLGVIADRAHPMTLSDLVESSEHGRLPDRAVAITSDDGYANIATTARPALEERQIPATLFAIGAPLIEGGEYWWDRLAAIVLVPGTLPTSLLIGQSGHRLELDLGPARAYSAAQWKADQQFRDGDNAGPRMTLYLRLWRHLQGLNHEFRNELLDQLANWSGSSDEPRNTHRNLTVEELIELDSGMVSIGGHTQTHPLLPELPLRQQRREIVANKRHLESILDRPLTTFSYPFGSHNKATTALVRSAGYRVAVTTRPSLVTGQTDRLRVGRFDVKNWSGTTFARRLEGWFRS